MEIYGVGSMYASDSLPVNYRQLQIHCKGRVNATFHCSSVD